MHLFIKKRVFDNLPRRKERKLWFSIRRSTNVANILNCFLLVFISHAFYKINIVVIMLLISKGKN